MICAAYAHLIAIPFCNLCLGLNMGILLKNSWSLLLGMFLLMIGNGLQGGLLAYRGEQEGFSALSMSFVMSAYFVGFLIGSRITTPLIKSVGHVRVYAAFASFVSAAFILFPLIPDRFVWMILRVLVGLCFASVYIVSESWLNHSVENDARGKLLASYAFVQTAGVVVAAWLLRAAPVGGYELFIIMSILVSLSFPPILLANQRAPLFEHTEPISLRELYAASPLGFAAVIVVGGVFALQFSMIGVYAAVKGLDVATLTLIITAIYGGSLITQYPIGWLSDRFDRRLVIIISCAFAAIGISIGILFADHIGAILIMAFLAGGVSGPLYSVSVAYINDRVAWEKMAGAAARIIFINGLGAVAAPIFAGYMMENYGPETFWLIAIASFAGLAGFGVYRSRIRSAVSDEQSASFAAVSPAATGVMMEVSQEYVVEQYEEATETAN